MNTPYQPAPKPSLRLNVFLLLGAVLLACTAFWCWHSIAATRGLTRAEAVIAGYSHGGEGLGRFISVYRFETASGKIVSVHGRFESSSPGGNPGDKVAIYYDPDHMERGVIIDSFGERWFGVTITGILGAAFLAIGVIARIWERETGGEPVQKKLSMAQRRAARTRELLMVGAGAIAIGTLCFGGAGLFFSHQFEIIRGYERTVGTVAYIADRVSRGDLQSRFHSSVVDFVAADGQKFEFAQGSTSFGATSGDKVTVFYDPHNPQRAIVEDFWDQWGVALLFAAIGVPFVAAGALICVTTLRSGRTGKRTRRANKRAPSGQ